MFPLRIKYILRYFSYWGFQSTTCTSLRKKSIASLIFLVHLSLCTWSSCRIFRSFTEKLAVMEFIDAMNFLLYYISCALTYWMTLFDSYFSYGIQCEFWKTFTRINEELPSTPQLKLSKWSFLITFIILLAGDCACVIFALFREVHSEYGGRIMHFIFLITVDHRIFFYWLHLKVIIFQLKKIKIKLGKQRAVGRENQLKWLCYYYRLVYEMSENVNSIFGWSHLALILSTFHSSITFLNFIFRQFLKKFNKFRSKG